VIYVIMENRSTDNLFAGDASLVAAGFDGRLTAKLVAWQPVTSATSPCIGSGLQIGCYMIFRYPLTHVPLTYVPGVNKSYDMCHFHACFTQQASNKLVAYRNAYYGNPPVAISQNPATALPNTGWGDSCQQTAGVTPCNGNSLANCYNGSSTGGCNANCPNPTPIPPTPTPFPNASPTPTPFPAGFACGLTYLNSNDVQPYWDIAKEFAISDTSWQTNQSPSFPSHMYATSAAALVGMGSTFTFISNLSRLVGGKTGCDGAGDTSNYVQATNLATGASHAKYAPCSNARSMFDELSTAGVTFKYYASQPNAPHYASYWDGLDMYANWGCSYTAGCPPRFTSHFGLESNTTTGSQILADIANCSLTQMSWVTPTASESDHGSVTDGSGPSWVASIVNAIGRSPCGYWSGKEPTVIFITWDDWGGWYDHAPPTIYNHGEDGFRVPLIAVSAYTKPGYISHVSHEVFGSVLKYVEELYGLPSLGTTDVRSDDLSDMFDYTQNPLTFVPIATNLPPSVKHGIKAIKVHGHWVDTNPEAVRNHLMQSVKTDHVCVDDCGDDK
jgi:phospholipase C